MKYTERIMRMPCRIANIDTGTFGLMAAVVATLLFGTEPSLAEERWHCTHGLPQLKATEHADLVEERGSSLLLFWGESADKPDVWQISISNAAALIAVNPVTNGVARPGQRTLTESRQSETSIRLARL
ncbi:MAG: hypothetical protein ABIQ90_09210 [Polaromonas sp.]